MGFRILLAAALPFAAAITGSGTSCATSPGPNLFTNPSFESGTAGWAFNFNPSTSSAYASDQSFSLVDPNNNQAPYTYVYQSVSDVVVGTSYTISFDWLVYAAASYSGTCTFSVFHSDVNVQGNRIGRDSRTYNATTMNWNTLSTLWLATESPLQFSVYISCDPKTTVYLDNFVLQEPAAVCPTSSSLSATSTSSRRRCTPRPTTIVV